MRTPWLIVTPLVPALLAWSSCAQQPRPSGELAIEVAALSLSGVGNAVYTIAVTNDLGQPVFSRTIDANTYGDGVGSLSYIGPCDATDGPDADLVATNRVNLTLDSLWSDAPTPVELSDFVDPTPVHLDVVCRENADTPVVFNLTIMRRANQGFFDVAVNFDDVFCSAKLDCQAPSGGTLDLLFDPQTGARVPTVVLATACTGGPGTDTHLYLDALTLTCGQTSVPIDIARPAPGNVYSSASPAPAPLVQAATYRGREALTQGNTNLSKLYYNVALGFDFDLATTSCALDFTMTAASEAFETPFTTPERTTWPLLRFVMPTLIAPSGDAFGCTRHPLDDPDAPPGTGVFTAYTGLATPRSFFIEAHHDGQNGLTVTRDVDLTTGRLFAATPLWQDGEVGTPSYDFDSGAQLFDTTQGTPLQGVRVEARHPDTNALLAFTTTAADGTFTLEVPDGPHLVTVDAGSLGLARSGGLVAGPLQLTGPTSNVDLAAFPPVTFVGTVFEDTSDSAYEWSGEPTLAGIEVSFYLPSLGLTFTTTTDAQGDYTIALPATANASEVEIRLDFNDPLLADYAAISATSLGQNALTTYPSTVGVTYPFDVALRPYRFIPIEVFVRWQYSENSQTVEAFGATVELWRLDAGGPTLVDTATVQQYDYYAVALFGSSQGGTFYGTTAREGSRYRVRIRDDLPPLAGSIDLIEAHTGDYAYSNAPTLDVDIGFFDASSHPIEDLYFELVPAKNGTIVAYPIYFDVNRNGTYDVGVDALLDDIDVNFYGPGSTLSSVSSNGRIEWANLTAGLPMYDFWIQGNYGGPDSPLAAAYPIIDGHPQGGGVLNIDFGETLTLPLSFGYTDLSATLPGTVFDNTGDPVPNVTLVLTPDGSPDNLPSNWRHWPALAAATNPATTTSSSSGGFVFSFSPTLPVGFYTLAIDATSIPDGYTLADTTPCEVFVNGFDTPDPCEFTLTRVAASAPGLFGTTRTTLVGTSSVIALEPTYLRSGIDLGQAGGCGGAIATTEGPDLSFPSVVLDQDARLDLIDLATNQAIGTVPLSAGTHTDLVVPLTPPRPADGLAHVAAELRSADETLLARTTFTLSVPVVDFTVSSQDFLAPEAYVSPTELTLERLRGASPGTNYLVAFSDNTGVLVGYASFTEPVASWPVTLTFAGQPAFDHDAPANMTCGSGGGAIFAPAASCPIDGGGYSFYLLSASDWAKYGTDPGQTTDLQCEGAWRRDVVGDPSFFLRNPPAP